MLAQTENDSLRGTLAHTNILDVLQFLATGGKTGELVAEREPFQTEGRAYFLAGNLVHMAIGDLVGMDALVEICGWENGNFRFFENVVSPKASITVSFQNAILEAVRIHDERREMREKSNNERSTEMSSTRSSTDVLEDLLKVPGVTSAVVVGRDGFIIESAGGSKTIAIDDLGAALAHAINGIEEMGSELNVDAFDDLFIEYGRAVIICKPAGDAVIAITAPDASKLGIIRHKVKPLVAELSDLF